MMIPLSRAEQTAGLLDAAGDIARHGRDRRGCFDQVALATIRGLE
jgi:hypothetical protein